MNSSQPQISPSLLAADFSRLAEAVGDVEASGADSLHLDLMDGRYVPNLSFGPQVLRALSTPNGGEGIPDDGTIEK